MADRAQLLVLSNPVEGQEDEYRRWYQDQHLHDVAKVPGVRGGRLWRLASDNGPTQHKFLAVYELDGDPTEVMAGLQQRAGSDAMPMSPALDMKTLSMSVWEPCGEHVGRDA